MLLAVPQGHLNLEPAVYVRTFCICPIGIQIGQRSLVADLLESLGGFVVHLQDAGGSPPAFGAVLIGHVEVCASTTGRLGSRVVGDGALEEDWGRQFGGVEAPLAKVSETRRGCVSVGCRLEDRKLAQTLAVYSSGSTGFREAVPKLRSSCSRRVIALQSVLSMASRKKALIASAAVCDVT